MKRGSPRISGTFSHSLSGEFSRERSASLSPQRRVSLSPRTLRRPRRLRMRGQPHVLRAFGVWALAYWGRRGRSLGRGAQVTLFFIVAALAALAVRSAIDAVRSSSLLPIRTIEVTGLSEKGHPHMEAEIRVYAGVEEGQSLLSIPSSELVRRVEEHPFVAQAEVRRAFPGDIRIGVTLRTPVAVLAISGALYLIDAEGRPFKQVRAGDDFDVPVVSGADEAMMQADSTVLRDAVSVVHAFAKKQSEGRLQHLSLEQIQFLAGVGFEIHFADGLQVRVGRTHLEEKFERLAQALQFLGQSNASARSIYLDDEQRPERVSIRLSSPTETQAAGGS